MLNTFDNFTLNSIFRLSLHPYNQFEHDLTGFINDETVNIHTKHNEEKQFRVTEDKKET